jgi:hypothetical protein
MARLPTNETPAQQRKRIDAQWRAAREREGKAPSGSPFAPLALGLTPLVLALMAILLSACGTTRPTVGIPTPVPCRVTLPAEPGFAFDDLAEGSDIFTQVSTLLADRRQRIDYERQLEAAARSCS